MKKTRIHPHADIQWEKAIRLFTRVPEHKEDNGKLSAQVILGHLAHAAEKGIVFLANIQDPAVVEYMLEGTGPLTWKNRRIINRFQKQGYAMIQEDTKGKITVKITKNGLIRALSYQLDTLQIKKVSHWDKKWRVVIFDVPEKYHRLRNMFRQRLLKMGMYRLQESIYISPYACFDEIEFLREFYNIAFTVRYLLVEKVEDDEFLLAHFHLA